MCFIHQSVSGRAQHGSPFKWDLTETCRAVSVGSPGGAGGDVTGLSLTVSVTLGTAQSSLNGRKRMAMKFQFTTHELVPLPPDVDQAGVVGSF